MANFGQGGPPGGMPPGYPPGSPGAPHGYGQHPQAPTAQPMGYAQQPPQGYPGQGYPGQGYPQQPHPGQGYPQQPAPHPQAPVAVGGVPTGKTVFGLPLIAGERVIYFEEGDYLIDIIVSWILAVVLLPILVGFYFAYKAITYRSSHPKVWILTNQRIIVVEGDGAVKAYYYHRDVRDIEAQRRKRDLVKNDGGGLMGSLMEAAANAAVNMVQDQVDKTAKLYWEDCEVIWLLMTNGQREKFDPPQKSHVGMMLARVMFQNSGNDEYEAEYKEAAPT